MSKKTFFLIIFNILFFSGCSLFSGQYEAEISYTAKSTNKNNTTYTEKELTEAIKTSSNQTDSKQSNINNLTNNLNNENMNLSIDLNKNYQAILHTEVGDIEIEFTTKETPITVNNFVTLAKNNFYNNTVFHRAISGFMIQGGCPNGDGSGNPGYRFDDESFQGEYLRGVIAMANAGPNTNGSQFFIMHQDYPLPKNYVIFGRVIKGLEVVDKIASAPVDDNGFGEMSKPVQPIKIKNINILEK